jgi:signal transduction histidine kinase
MASSISHDLRHYLSAMYANAEFMSNESLPQAEREELLIEVKVAVQGMTDLLDSLLLFTQTGRALQPGYDSIAGVIQRAVAMVRSHPAARDVRIVVAGLSSIEAWIDAKKLGRAIYNLLLNACQAACRGMNPPLVTLSLEEDERCIRIKVADNGPGVAESIRNTMFLPFVSEGKESGVGLGLTLAQQIAHEHGGSIDLDETFEGHSIFTITLPKAALHAHGATQDRKALQVT